MNRLLRPAFFLSRTIYRSAMCNQMPKVFPERVLLDVRHIENLWKRSKENGAVNKYLYHCYVQNPDFLSYTLEMINYACIRCISSGESCSLVNEIIRTFGRYIEENNIAVSPTFEQKTELLFSILKFRSYEIIKLVCTVFKFEDQAIDYKQIIKNLIQEQKFIEAAYIVSVLRLQKEFDINEILMPLLFQGSTHIPAIYLQDYPDLQLQIAKILDNYLVNYGSTPDDSYVKPKKILRSLSHLISVFKIPLDSCPNMQFIRRKSAINILIRKLGSQLISEAVWEEMTKDLVKNNEDLKKHLIQKLIYKKDMKTAIKMAKLYNLNIADFHIPEIQYDLNEKMEIDQCEELEDFDVVDISDEYLKFTLKAEDLKLIDKKDDFINCIDDIKQNYQMLAIDSEWKAGFGLHEERLSLIQLAVHDKVYILDLLSLSKCLDAEHWDKLLDDIFGNPNLIKLGFDVMNDLNKILENIKGTKGKTIRFSHILDMQLFYAKLLEVYPIEMHNTSDNSKSQSLSSVCEIVLGKPLNKEDQLCNWDRRPLTQKQLEYAAIDTHCLLLIYDKLKEEAVKKDMNFEHLAKVAIVLTTSQSKSKRKRKVTGERTLQNSSSIPIEQLKVVTDLTFEKQAKELRKLGADVIILNEVNSLDAAIELTKREGRIIICPEKLYYEIKFKVKPGFCYFFPSDIESVIQVSNFLQHFNAKVSPESFLSRCLNCNSDQGIKVFTQDLQILCELGKKHTSMNSVLQDNLPYLSPELQIALQEILTSDKTVKFVDLSSSVYEHAFLCKQCGNIS